VPQGKPALATLIADTKPPYVPQAAPANQALDDEDFWGDVSGGSSGSSTSFTR